MKLRPDRKAVHVVMSIDLHERLNNFANTEYSPVTVIIKEAIKEYLNKYEIKPTISQEEKNKNELIFLMKQHFINDEWSRGLEFINSLENLYISYLIIILRRIEIVNKVDRMSGFIYWSKWKLSTSFIIECRESFNKKYPYRQQPI